MHQIDSNLLKKSSYWREDICFTQEVLGKPFTFKALGEFFARKIRRRQSYAT